MPDDSAAASQTPSLEPAPVSAPQRKPRPPKPSLARRIGGWLVAFVVGLACVIGLMLFLNSRDQAHVDPSAVVLPGEPFTTPEQYLDATQVRLLRAGDVYLLYGDRRAPAELTALQRQLSGAPDPALEEAGQAVVLVRRAGLGGVVALGGERILRAPAANDPQLEPFASTLLGGAQP
ncbi:hypothetical protein Q5424_09580 [Conexibacter sp. JD483]|uniref:hypothetical protein n=1 Tax=unclassified Conexibacter TaxID=2627773 RepID=UPI00271FABC0|nr:MULTISPECIES: hypothetical protein [unclassified Conexibacter]MDO8185456.1 hypothetical protein [Conexibacter sp. CPCC 205706]MDO8198368.1 hypothetical protein [Conexibacter sp. CPCC 205762]MDR9369330.1 hypothetical protein [Conexibacter sp. JD483]